jgi:hypothetical protein
VGALATYEAIIDRSGVAPRLEALLPVGVRPRQLGVRTLLIGICLVLADGRPAHVSRVHRALVALREDDGRRLGVTRCWKSGPHLLTYRQVERTLGLVVIALRSESRGGMPSALLQEMVDALVEASVASEYKEATSSYAVDWTDVESFARAPLQEGAPTSDPDASWGHRRGNGPGQRDELFFGYYLQLATMVRDESRPGVPELVRRLLLSACHVDPPPAFVSVLEEMAAAGVTLADVLADSGYAHRIPAHWALALRALGANLIMDLHPHDRGTQGTHQGAICFNGNLYCPATPPALFTLEPLGRGASEVQIAAHDVRSAELDRYRFGPISADDADGYHRVVCPAVANKVRCPRREASMALSYTRPEIAAPLEEPPTCCVQQSITVPPSVNAKTRQKHPYPSRAHRHSYARRSAAERSNATVKDPASNDIARGWCRLIGLEAMTIMVACLFVVRNQRMIASFAARQRDDERRLAAGLAPKTRQRRRKSINDLLASTANAPP